MKVLTIFTHLEKTLTLPLIDAKVDSTYINQIIGWEGKDTRETYYSGHDLLSIKKELEKLHYDFLEPAFAEWKKIMAEK